MSDMAETEIDVGAHDSRVKQTGESATLSRAEWNATVHKERLFSAAVLSAVVE